MITVTYQYPDMEREAEKEFTDPALAHKLVQDVTDNDGWAEVLWDGEED
jgi:hypothetical protein